MSEYIVRLKTVSGLCHEKRIAVKNVIDYSMYRRLDFAGTVDSRKKTDYITD